MDEKELEFMRKRYEAAHEAATLEAKHFKTIIYPSYTNDEKARYWAGGIRQLMRNNQELGYEEDWTIAGQYEYYKKEEPKIDELLEGIAKYLRYSPELFIRILKEGK